MLRKLDTNGFDTEVEGPQNSAAHLTLIIAIRADDFSDYRTRLSLRDKLDLRGVATIVVDDGSPSAAAADIRDFCNARGWEYQHLDTGNKRFSLSRARNAGIYAANSEWICFEDADLAYPSDHYQRLIEECELLSRSPFNFLTVPVIYLTKQASERVHEVGIDNLKSEYVSAALFENPLGGETGEVVQSFAPASSVIAVRKSIALAAGAFDEHFEGWGGEDRDFAFRLLHLNQRIDKPPHFDATKSWNLNDTVAYEGWRSLYRLQGDFLAMKGVYGFHLFHEPAAWKDGTKHNIQFAAEKAKQISKSGRLVPAYDPGKPSDILLGRNPHILCEQVLDTLENPRVVAEVPGSDPVDFANNLLALSPRSILLWNPYGSPWRKAVYAELRAREANLIVGERGALPRSLYFDKGGLCIESPSYAEHLWNYLLSPEDRQSAQSYVDHLRYGNSALEKQADRKGSGLTRLSLGIPPEAKVVFVALQLSSDTVTTNFISRGREYAAFLLEVQRLSLNLPLGWLMVVKNHPLSTEKLSLPSAINGDEYHINDLISAADAVCVFNSGVGLLSMAFDKPAFCYGRAFYQFDGLNEVFPSAEVVARRLQDLAPVDHEKMLRFYAYLTQKAWSFADWSGRTVKTQSSFKFVLEKLTYETLRIPGLPERQFTSKSVELRRSVLFDRYRHQDYVSRQKTPSAPASTAINRQNVASPQDLYSKGCTKFHQHEFLAAADFFDRASKLDAKSPTYARAAAEAFDRAGDHRQALQRLKLASTVSPSNKNIARRTREISRPSVVRRFLSERPFPIPKA